MCLQYEFEHLETTREGPKWLFFVNQGFLVRFKNECQQISSDGELSDFVSDLGALLQTFFENFYEPMEIVYFQGPRFLGSLRYI